MKHSAASQQLSICDQPTKDEIVLIGERLHEYNLEQTAGKYDEPGCGFGLVVKDPQGEVVGGV